MTTVSVVGLGVYAESTTVGRLGGGTTQRAGAVVAKLPGGAGCFTGTTICPIGLQVYANSRTIGLARRTGTRSTDTDLASGALGSTATAMIGIGLRINTSSTAGRLARRTRERAFGVHAQLTGGTGRLAGATVGPVRAEVHTNTRAIGLA